MNDIGAMVSELISAGCNPEVAARVVAQAFVSGVSSAEFRGIPVDVSAEKRRAYDRERKRNVRGIPRNSTGHPRSSENASLSKEERIESKEERKREGTARGSRLPVGWTPTSQDWAVACELLSEQRSRSELEKFTDHWKQQPGSKGVKLDWSAAWRNWIRRAAEYSGRNGTAAKPLTPHQIERENSRRILDELDRYAIGSSGSEANSGLLRFDPGDQPEGVHGGVRGDVVAVPATRLGKSS